MPIYLIVLKHSKGEMAFRHWNHANGKIFQMVFFLTTKHVGTVTECSTKAKRERINKVKLDCDLDYNIHKTGVYHNDQLVTYYSFKQKTIKTWGKWIFSSSLSGQL